MYAVPYNDQEFIAMNPGKAKYTHAQIMEALAINNDHDSMVASTQTGICSSTIRRWRRLLKGGGELVSSDDRVVGQAPEYSYPDIPDPNLPIEEIIDIREKAFELQKEHDSVVKWMPIKMRTNEPIMVCFVGDPHVDDDGCNWSVLKNDIKTFQKPGVYCVNIGDTINNWSGRLTHLYAEQETSRQTAIRLGRWFVGQAKWLTWIRGNHDLWTPAGLIDEDAGKFSHVSDWESKFKVVFPNEFEIKVHAAHNFKGTSIYNKLHGAKRQAMFSGSEADVYVQGHHHEWNCDFYEDENNHRVVTLIKVRGYKFHDDYATLHGFGEQQYGSTIGVIVDPTGDRCKTYPYYNIQDGYKYLEYLRSTA